MFSILLTLITAVVGVGGRPGKQVCSVVLRVSGESGAGEAVAGCLVTPLAYGALMLPAPRTLTLFR